MIIIDRFEGDFVVLEDADMEKFSRVDRAVFPKNAREGDVVEERGGVYTVNSEATAKRRRQIVERLRKMGL
ncbi:MAG: DUF3006 domain-containing protein [Oscillospiraceae bacterium]|jgi:hypothetical protein|nr:DUF3006 domain-containing protein [Oscillospiraceae bacterium]